MRLSILGFVAGLVTLPILAGLYLAAGRPPVAVADRPLPLEHEIVDVPLDARIHREYPRTVSINPAASDMQNAVRTYRAQCASCHGLPRAPSAFGSQMYPDATQLWESHGKGVVGVSDDPPGVTYWKIKNGIRLSGMPAFEHILSDTEMWQVTNLVAGADKLSPTELLDQPRQASSVGSALPTK